MAKFFMSCPFCGSYVEGKTGFLDQITGGKSDDRDQL